MLSLHYIEAACIQAAIVFGMTSLASLAPIRRTVKYLDSGPLILKDRVKIFSINYNTKGKHHEGAREFVFWFLPQVQYKNPDVQVISFKNMTPTPFIRCYLEKGEQVLVDIDGKSKDEIMDHLIKVIGKSRAVLEKEMQAKEKKDNPANFGYYCDRHCICEIPGQVPCTSLVKLPKSMRGKYIHNLKE